MDIYGQVQRMSQDRSKWGWTVFSRNGVGRASRQTPLETGETSTELEANETMRAKVAYWEKIVAGE